MILVCRLLASKKFSLLRPPASSRKQQQQPEQHAAQLSRGKLGKTTAGGSRRRCPRRQAAHTRHAQATTPRRQLHSRRRARTAQPGRHAGTGSTMADAPAFPVHSLQVEALQREQNRIDARRARNAERAKRFNSGSGAM